MPRTVVTYYSETDLLLHPDVYGRAYSILPGYRREKADSFVFAKDKALSVGVWLLLRRALEDLGEDPDKIRINYLKNGKPVLEGSDIQFNLSHSEHRVMCSVSDIDLGCDVEHIEPIDMDIARRYFFGSEYETISSSEDREGMFYRFWTLKESFMKATGLGFELPLDSFCIRLGERISVDQTVDGKDYSFKEYHTNDGYRYAVCSLNDDFIPEMEHIDLAKYLQSLHIS
ncbi:MAG: 4'-phosphopantetheinyl transferase superfamily protein [Thermoplasmata archaeon]|nr:4'-phosphopantetheinyl transferase superfamily protein [Thermoplasmata archaeon]